VTGVQTCALPILDFRPYNGAGKFEFDDFGMKKINLFTGYNPVVFETEIPDEEVMTNIREWRHLVLHLMGNEEKCRVWYEHYLAHLIQYPNKRIAKSVVIKGAEGTGKNLHLKPIGNIIGFENYISSSKVDDFFGMHAMGFYNKLIVNMNEIASGGTYQYEGNIKSFITDEKVTVNQKFKDLAVIDNLSRLILFTNKNNPVRIMATEDPRRWFIVETTQYYLQKDARGNKKFTEKHWKAIADKFDSPVFLASLYKYLNKLDVDNFDFTKKRPITEAYKRMIKRCMPDHISFLEEFITQCKFEYDCRADVKFGTFKFVGKKVQHTEQIYEDVEEDDGKGNLIKVKKFKCWVEGTRMVTEEEQDAHPLTMETFVVKIPEKKEECAEWDKTVSFVGSQLFERYNKWCEQRKIERAGRSYRNFYDDLESLGCDIKEGENHGTKIFKFNPKHVWDIFVLKKFVKLTDDDFNLEDHEGIKAPEDEVDITPEEDEAFLNDFYGE